MWGCRVLRLCSVEEIRRLRFRWREVKHRAQDHFREVHMAIAIRVHGLRRYTIATWCHFAHVSNRFSMSSVCHLMYIIGCCKPWVPSPSPCIYLYTYTFYDAYGPTVALLRAPSVVVRTLYQGNWVHPKRSWTVESSFSPRLKKTPTTPQLILEIPLTYYIAGIHG